MTNEQWKNLKWVHKIQLLTQCAMTYKEATEIVCDDIKDLPDEIQPCIENAGIPKDSREYDCENHCPNCGADGDAEGNVFWGSMEADYSSAWQEAECQKCGCIFNEVYTFSHTEIRHDSPVPKEI